MAKKKDIGTAGDTLSPAALDGFEPFAVETASMGWLYCGPDYDLGIQVPGVPGLLRPREWGEAQINAFMERHPKYAAWWTYDTNHAETNG